MQGGQDFSSIADFMSRFGVTSMDDSADKMMAQLTQVTTGKGGGGPTKQAVWPRVKCRHNRILQQLTAVVWTWMPTPRSHPLLLTVGDLPAGSTRQCAGAAGPQRPRWAGWCAPQHLWL